MMHFTFIRKSTHQICFLVLISDVRLRAEVAPPLHTVSVTQTYKHTAQKIITAEVLNVQVVFRVHLKTFYQSTVKRLCVTSYLCWH